VSVLDLVPRAAGTSATEALRHSLDLARLADRLGYTRLWYAEHHNAGFLASTAPDLMIALAAPVTERIRLGAGGVMLPNHAALQVAERYRMLEALAPGRIDLGLGRAPGTDGVTAMALRGSAEAVHADPFRQKLAELFAFADDRFPDDHPYRTVRAQPADVPLPPVWILGSSAYGAGLAASLGLPYGFAGHFSDLPPELPLRAYRDAFTPSGNDARPYALVTLAVIAAETEDEVARQVALFEVNVGRAFTGRPAGWVDADAALAYAFTDRERAIATAFRARVIAGTPDDVATRIGAVVDRTGADEVMVSLMAAYDPGVRRRTLELMASAFGLRGGGVASGRTLPSDDDAHTSSPHPPPEGVR
jgi:luciferase family oxidoreductase group 1